MKVRALKSRLGSRRGSEFVEGMLVLIPLLALIFLVIDTSWGLFIRATIQYAAQAGVNYAVAGGTGANGQMAAITQEVQTQSSGLLTSGGTITVNYMSAANQQIITNQSGANVAGNIVGVGVTYTFRPLAPLFRSGMGIPMTATAAGVIQSTSAPTM